MNDALLCPVAYVDFRAAMPLAQLGRVLSEHLFGGIQLIGDGTGIWDEVPALRLANRFLGMSVELGGANGEYTLQIETPEFPWAAVPEDRRAEASADLTGYVEHLLFLVPGIIRSPTAAAPTTG